MSTGGKFETSNEICPVAEFSIDYGDESFVLTSNDAAEFAMTMNDAANQVEQEYPYVVRATAEGGSTETVAGEMLIAKVCLAELVETFETSFSYDLPEFGQEFINLPAASTDYISQPDFTQGCNQTFAVRLANGRPLPDELVIDELTGIITLTNDATIKRSYDLEIDIRTTDNIPENHIDLTVTGITIEVVCGPDSTTLTPPVMEEQRKPSVDDTGMIIKDAEFATSNPLCPVALYELTSASAHNNSETEAPFIMNQNLPTFTINLDPS